MSKKDLAHEQHMPKMSKASILVETLSKIFGNKRRKLGTIITNWQIINLVPKCTNTNKANVFLSFTSILMMSPCLVTYRRDRIWTNIDFASRILEAATIGRFKGHQKMDSYESVSDVAVARSGFNKIVV